MLALDHERFRFLRAWEAMSPVPPPLAADGAEDPRAVAARAASQSRPNPEQHIHDTDGPEEDQAMLAPLVMQAYNPFHIIGLVDGPTSVNGKTLAHDKARSSLLYDLQGNWDAAANAAA